MEYSGVQEEYKWSTSGVHWSTSGVREVRWSNGVPESRFFPLVIHSRITYLGQVLLGTQVIQSDSRIASDHVGLYRKNYRILSDPMEIRRKLPAS